MTAENADTEEADEPHGDQSMDDDQGYAEAARRAEDSGVEQESRALDAGDDAQEEGVADKEVFKRRSMLGSRYRGEVLAQAVMAPDEPNYG